MNRQHCFSLALAVLVVCASLSGPAPARAAELIPAERRVPVLRVQGAEQPVRLTSLSIQTTIQGGFAESSLDMVFFNPNARILEGELQFPLLPEQSISGLALDMGSELRQAVPVEKAKGQEIFEDVARRNVDPALLEAVQGGSYRLRVYPIPAKGQRRVVVRVLQPLTPENDSFRYRLPLAFATRLEHFSLEALVASPEGTPTVQAGALGLTLQAAGTLYRGKVEQSQITPEGWLDITLPAPTAMEKAVSAVRWNNRQYFSAAALVAAETKPRALPSCVTIVWDGSGSGAKRNHSMEFALLDKYFQAFGTGEARLIVVRDVAEAPKRFSIANGDWHELKNVLGATVYDGGTNLADWLPTPDCVEYLLFSDGLANFGPDLGEKTFPALGDRQRLFAVASVAPADLSALRLAARQGAVIDLLNEGLEHSATTLLFEGIQVSLDTSALAGRGQVELSQESRRLAGKSGQNALCRLAGWVEKDAATANEGIRLRLTSADGTTRNVAVPLPAWDATPEHKADDAPLAARLWGSYAIAELEGEFRRNKRAIVRLGQELGLVSRETSLLVLETAEDYVRYDVAPPPSLKAEVESMRGRSEQRLKTGYLPEETLRNLWQQKTAWWEKDFPWDAQPKKEKPKKGNRADEDSGTMHREAVREAAPESPLAHMPRSEMRQRQAVASAPAPQESAKTQPSGSGGEMAIRLRPWASDAPYIARMREAKDADLYAIYLDERPDYVQSSAFFLDAADRFFERDMPELGLRVLSNLAELELENRQLLRMLAYRLVQAKQLALALPIWQRVRELAPYEPQSLRDLALTLSSLGRSQEAVDLLHETARRVWDSRFGDVNTIALTEMNALIACAALPLKTEGIDSALLKNLPVDLRVVLAWDADNTDMDLWVTGPDGESASYNTPLTTRGGHMSKDCTRGYGPEEFMLKKAAPGTYRVEADYFGSTRQTLAGEVTMMVTLITGFGTPEQKEERITLRLKNTKSRVLAAEFVVK
jgi:Uncharacterized protein conserved in bacteria